MKKWYNIVAILMSTVIVLGMFVTACAQKPAEPQATGPISS
jgi:outer membrane lipoprotein-sorting protein